jgi:chorismate dehydratase
MQKISISVVAYANSLPFVYGLLHSKLSEKLDVQIGMPSVCADKLINDAVDISLVPVAEILRLKDFNLVSDLCIGAYDYVKTVLLASECPLNELNKIYLDYQSRTSVILVQVLAKNYWNIAPEWQKATAGYESNVIKGHTGAVIIGDRAFSVQTKYKYDLSHEWKNFTRLPFVFAAWLTQRKIPAEFIEEFNSALHFGIQNKMEAISIYNHTTLSNNEIYKYLEENIDYKLNSEKKKALSTFLDYAKEFVPNANRTYIQNIDYKNINP